MLLPRILLVIGLSVVAATLPTRSTRASPAAEALVDAAGVVDSLEHASWPKSPAVMRKPKSHDAKPPMPVDVGDSDGDADDSGPAPSPKSPAKTHKSHD